LSACPGDEVVINCDASENTADTTITLRWEITLINRMVPEIHLFLNNVRNNTNRQGGGLEFYAAWTSYSPLRAVLTTTAHSVLDGATVMCEGGSAGSSSSDSLTVRVTQIGNNY
jgi:hypothetical protein